LDEINTGHYEKLPLLYGFDERPWLEKPHREVVNLSRHDLPKYHSYHNAISKYIVRSSGTAPNDGCNTPVDGCNTP
jgi:hypothetical protein